MDLAHIKGRAIVEGDVRSLSNLIHIFLRICAITSDSNDAEPSTTSQADVENEHLREYETIFDNIQISNTASPRRFLSPRSSSLLYARSSGDSNEHSSEQAMLRKIYGGLLKSMCSWYHDDQLEKHQRVARVREGARASLRAIHGQFEERVDALRAQFNDTVTTAVTHDEAQRVIRNQLRNAYSDRQRRMLNGQKRMVREQRLQEVARGRAANLAFKAFQRAEQQLSS